MFVEVGGGCCVVARSERALQDLSGEILDKFQFTRRHCG